MSVEFKNINTSNHTRSDNNIIQGSDHKLNFQTIQSEDINIQDKKKRVNINDLLKELKNSQKKTRTLNMIVSLTLISLIAVIGIFFSL